MLQYRHCYRYTDINVLILIILDASSSSNVWGSQYRLRIQDPTILLEHQQVELISKSLKALHWMHKMLHARRLSANFAVDMAESSRSTAAIASF